MQIAIVDKSLNNTKYQKHYKLQEHDVDVFHMCNEKLTGRLLKKHITIGTEENPFNPFDYDAVILIGAEPFLYFTGKKGIADYSGKRVEHNGYTKFIASISPAQLHFKPEMQPIFDATVEEIHLILEGKEKVAKPGDYKPITSEEEALEYIKMVYTMIRGPVSFDSESSALYARDGYMLGLSMSHQEYQGVYIDSEVLNEECVVYLQKILDSEEHTIVFHNLKFDMHFYSYHLGLNFEKAHADRRLHDTMLQHYVLDERRGTHGLKALAMKYTDMGNYDEELDLFKDQYCKTHKMKKEDFTYDLIPFEIMWPYAAKDTDATIRLHNFFLPKIEANDRLASLYYDVLIPGCVFLQRVEDRGVPVSKARLKAALSYLTEKLASKTKELYTFEEVIALEKDQASPFNSNSVPQLRKLLFDYIGLEPTGKLTDTGADSTDADVLMELSSQHPIAGVLLEMRKTTKLLSTYVNKMLLNIDADGCIRTGFHEHMTTSGRLSSSGKLNLQQLPRDESIIKGCIVAPEGYRVISWDLTTAEVYYAAVLSGDRELQQVFINMQNDPANYSDFHGSIAHLVFGLTCKPTEVKKLFPALRQAAKAISFGILYGSGKAKVAASVNEALLEQSVKTGERYVECTPADAQGYIDTYFDKFPRLKKWIAQSHDQIKNYGFIYSHFGRKRRLHNINSEDRGVQGEEIRSGFNAIIQSASSDSLLLGAIDADNEIISMGLENEMKIVMLVHDSVVAIVREDLVDQYNEILLRNIQKDRGISIPGCPIGVESDSEKGGSRDYSCGKIKVQHPEIAVLEDPEFTQYVSELINDPAFSELVHVAKTVDHPEHKDMTKLDKAICLRDWSETALAA
ncbi:DNA polymerase [Pectobacterium phage DU_PP_V]|uniref:DNA polymerase n=1 Tax=Pectobacterium phage DU_PP_V TaxID=2041492 RepID=A0A2D2W7B0_9CAUD|nr:DNA polymerase [Pectobacterium phage DU_PP_V]ATS94080.1 DNA polymerase [Pectobacterium phage DU_PP_V]